MSTQLDIFEQRFGDERTPKTRLTTANDNSLGEAGLKMLQAVQTVVDVLAPEGTGYRVGFADTSAAFTDHKTRRITITGLPLLDAKPGTPYRDIAAILTGFAVHEVGHTKKVGIIDAVRAEWPDKMLPKTLGNIIEDVVLEARVIERYAGFLHVFDAAFEWVAKATCPKHTLVWEGSTGNRVNIAGQIVRYRDYVRFGSDQRTQDALRWWDEWASRINAKTGPKEGVALVREALAYLAATADEEPPVQQPPTKQPPGPGPKGPKLPDEDEDEDEPKGPGGTQPGTPDEDPDEDEDPTDGGDEPGDDDGGDDTEGGDDDGDDTEGGDDDGDGEGEGGDHGGSIADTEHRIDLGDQTNDGAGSGGSGQGVGKSSDDDGSDPDDFDPNVLMPDLDSVIDNIRGEDYTLQGAVDEERTTTRMEAGIHGKIRVIWK